MLQEGQALYDIVNREKIPITKDNINPPDHRLREVGVDLSVRDVFGALCFPATLQLNQWRCDLQQVVSLHVPDPPT